MGHSFAFSKTAPVRCGNSLGWRVGFAHGFISSFRLTKGASPFSGSCLCRLLLPSWRQGFSFVVFPSPVMLQGQVGMQSQDPHKSPSGGWSPVGVGHFSGVTRDWTKKNSLKLCQGLIFRKNGENKLLHQRGDLISKEIQPKLLLLNSAAVLFQESGMPFSHVCVIHSPHLRFKWGQEGLAWSN